MTESVHVKLGVPTDADPSDDYLMDKGVYVTSYNPNRRGANWVAWRLQRGDLGEVKRKNKFESDDALPGGMLRVHASDYSGSGYDRGHLCPSADRTSDRESNQATFLMTNIHPQVHELNDGPWRELEEHERLVASRERKELYIVAGGVFGRVPSTIGRAAVAVPDASFKIIAVLEPGQGAGEITASTPLIAAIMPNRPGISQRPWRAYLVSVDDVEQATGYDYLSAIAPSIQRVIEAKATVAP